ncbi:MAG: hypothetical protein M3451_10610, partial [Chloroflexota bacterium]|nr:hypothetical protein [Chloroflexota bacterium]
MLVATDLVSGQQTGHVLMRNVHISTHPLVRHKVTLLSDRDTDHKTFRELVRELTRLLIYEATDGLPLREVNYNTPLERATGQKIAARIGLVPI